MTEKHELPIGQRISLPGVKVGRHCRFHKDAVDAWLKNQTPKG